MSSKIQLRVGTTAQATTADRVLVRDADGAEIGITDDRTAGVGNVRGWLADPDDMSWTDQAAAEPRGIWATPADLDALGLSDLAVPTGDVPFGGHKITGLASGGATTTNAANIGDIQAAINALINSAPGTLDTLGEIATLLGADDSALSALTTLVGLKATIANPSFTGTVTLPTGLNGLAKLASGVVSAAAQGTDYYAPSGTDVAVADGGTGASTLASGGVLKGHGTSAVTADATINDLGAQTADYSANSHKITSLANGSASGDAVNKGQLDAAIAALVNSAPGILDTLGEIATLLSADDSALTALTAVVGAKAPINNAAFTGTFTIPTGFTGLLKAAAGVVSAAVAGTDYARPSPVPVFRTTDLARISTSALADDTQLTIASVPAGTYELYALLIMDGATNADFKIGWTLPASSTMAWCGDGIQSAAAGAVTQAAVDRAYLAAADSVVIGTTNVGQKTIASPRGWLVTTGSGTVTLQWAQGTSQATNTTLFTGSYLRLLRVA